VNLGTAAGLPGATISIPVTLVLNQGMSLDSLIFGVSLTPGTGAPAITSPLTFRSDTSSPSLVANGTNPTSIGLSFLDSLSASGTTYLGNIVAVIPTNASIGQGYTAALTATPSASQGSNVVYLFAGPPVQISVGYTYLVGDAYPYTSDDASGFGDGQLNTLDLITALRAVTKLPGFVPDSCSDRFDAMDSYPIDTVTQRGGDGLLTTLDLIETLKRITNIDTSRPIRAARGLPCADSVATPDAVRRGATVGAMWFGEAQPLQEGVMRVPVYLSAGSSQDLAGLSFAVGMESSGNSLQFVPAGIGAPSLIDSGEPGALALAWLNGLQIPAGNVVLGYLQVGGVDPANFSLVFYGVDANRRAGGHAVQFATPRRP
jgi:hypothetical protein